jgi:four helix bundle protein
MNDPDTILRRKFIEFAKLLNIYLNHFPKHEKYSLCKRIRDTSYEIYDLITEGCKRYHKKTSLTSLDIAHERLRMQIYLAHELGYFNNIKRYLIISSLVDELGKMIGAWIKKEKDNF